MIKNIQILLDLKLKSHLGLKNKTKRITTKINASLKDIGNHSLINSKYSTITYKNAHKYINSNLDNQTTTIIQIHFISKNKSSQTLILVLDIFINHTNTINHIKKSKYKFKNKFKFTHRLLIKFGSE